MPHLKESCHGTDYDNFCTSLRRLLRAETSHAFKLDATISLKGNALPESQQEHRGLDNLPGIILTETGYSFKYVVSYNSQASQSLNRARCRNNETGVFFCTQNNQVYSDRISACEGRMDVEIYYSKPGDLSSDLVMYIQVQHSEYHPPTNSSTSSPLHSPAPRQTTKRPLSSLSKSSEAALEQTNEDRASPSDDSSSLTSQSESDSNSESDHDQGKVYTHPSPSHLPHCLMHSQIPQSQTFPPSYGSLQYMPQIQHPTNREVS